MPGSEEICVPPSPAAVGGDPSGWPMPDASAESGICHSPFPRAAGRERPLRAARPPGWPVAGAAHQSARVSATAAASRYGACSRRIRSGLLPTSWASESVRSWSETAPVSSALARARRLPRRHDEALDALGQRRERGLGPDRDGGDADRARGARRATAGGRAPRGPCARRHANSTSAVVSASQPARWPCRSDSSCSAVDGIRAPSSILSASSRAVVRSAPRPTQRIREAPWMCAASCSIASALRERAGDDGGAADRRRRP